MRPVGVVVLAAGKGTRMRSQRPKVAHTVAGRAMLEHALRAAAGAIAPISAASASTNTPVTNSAVSADHPADASQQGAEGERDDAHPPQPGPLMGQAPNTSDVALTRFVVVLGHAQEAVRASLHWAPPDGALTFVTQATQLGTGDAVRIAREAVTQTIPRLPGAHDLPGAADPTATIPGIILVMYGDTPLIRAATLRALLAAHEAADATLTFLTGMTTMPTDYGRVVRDAAGRVRGVVEQRHASAEELRIPEVNSGVYLFAADWLWSRLDQLTSHPNGEYYLTDLVEVAVREGRPIATVTAPLEETLGVNDRVQLAEAERIMRDRILREHMLNGVTIEDPGATYVECDVRIGQDTLLRPGTALRGATVIGARCEIGPQSVVRDSQIGDDCRVVASWVEEAIIEAGAKVGPMSHLRPGARLASGAYLGNFAEVKNATIGPQTQMHHFSYIGDATIGAGTNVGAGTITMNYDGRDKHHTEIGAGVFLGCDTLLRAPVSVGDGATTGGGAVVTRDVPPGQLAVGMPARIVRRVRSVAPVAQPTPAETQPGAPTATPADAATLRAGEHSQQLSDEQTVHTVESVERASANRDENAQATHPAQGSEDDLGAGPTAGPDHPPQRR